MHTLRLLLLQAWLTYASSTSCGTVKDVYIDQCCGGEDTDLYDVCKVIGSPPECSYEFTVLEPDVMTDTNKENYNVMFNVNFDSLDELQLIRHMKFKNVDTDFGDKLGQFAAKPQVIGDSFFVSFSGPNKPGTNTTADDSALYRPFYVARFNRFTFEQYWVCKLNDVFASYDEWANWGGRDYTGYWGGVTPNVQLYHTIPLSEDGEHAYFSNTKFAFGNEMDDYWLLKMDASKTGNCNVLYGTHIGAIPERYISGNNLLLNPGYGTTTRAAPNVFKDDQEENTLIAMPLQASMEYFLSTHFQPATFLPRVSIDQVGAYSQIGGLCFVRDTGTELVYKDTYLFGPERLEGFTDLSRTDFKANILERDGNGKPVKQYIDICTYLFVTTLDYGTVPATCYEGSVTSAENRYYPRGYVRKDISEEDASPLTVDSFIGEENCLELNVPISKEFVVTDGTGDTSDVANLDQMIVKKNWVELYTCPELQSFPREETVALTCEVPFYLREVADLILDRDVTMEINAWYDMISGGNPEAGIPGSYGGYPPAYATGFEPNGKPLEIVPRSVSCTDESGNAVTKTFTAINPNGDTAVQANFPIGNYFVHPGGPYTYDAVGTCGPTYWVCEPGDDPPPLWYPSSNSCEKRNIHIKREYVVGKLEAGLIDIASTHNLVAHDGTVVPIQGSILHRQEVRKELCRNLVSAGYKLDASEAYRLNYAGTGTWGQGMAFDTERRELVIPTSNANWMPNHEMMSVLNSEVLRTPVDVQVSFLDGSVSSVTPSVPYQTFLCSTLTTVAEAGSGTGSGTTSSGHACIFYTKHVPNIISTHPYVNETNVNMKAFTFYPHGLWGLSKIDNYDPTMYDTFQIQKESFYLNCDPYAYPYNPLCRGGLTDEQRDASLLSLAQHWKNLNDRMVSSYDTLVSPRGRLFPYSSMIGMNIDTYEMTWRTSPAELDVGWHSERWYSGDLGTFYPFVQNPRGNVFVQNTDDAATPSQELDSYSRWPQPVSSNGLFGWNNGPQVMLEDLMKRINNLPVGGDSDVNSQVTNVNGKWYAVAKQGCIYTVLNSSIISETGFVSHTIRCPTTSTDFVGNFNYGYSMTKIRDYFACTTTGCAPQPTQHRLVYTLRNQGDVGNPFFGLDDNGALKKVDYGTKLMIIYDVEQDTMEYVTVPDTASMTTQDGATGVNCFRASRDRYPVCYFVSLNGQMTFVDLGTKRIKKKQLRTGAYKFPPTLIDDAMYFLPDTFDSTQMFLGNIYAERAFKSNKVIDIYTMGPRGIKRTCE